MNFVVPSLALFSKEVPFLANIGHYPNFLKKSLLAFIKSASLTTTFLASFHDLEITQFWSVNYICLVYKFKFLFWTFLEIFRKYIGDCKNLFFDENVFKILYLCFPFIQKAAELVLKKLSGLRSYWS